MKIKEILKGCSIYPPNVVISLLINGEWMDIELYGDGDYSDFIEEHGDRDVCRWIIENIDTETYIFFIVKEVS